MSSTSQVFRAVEACALVAERVRLAGDQGISAGELYAMMLGVCDLATFERLVETVIRAKLVKRKMRHLLVWCGPKLERTASDV